MARQCDWAFNLHYAVQLTRAALSLQPEDPAYFIDRCLLYYHREYLWLSVIPVLGHMFDHLPVLIRGAGDLASGVAIRLFRSGFPVIMTEIEHPLTVRRSVAFAQAIFDGETVVEDIHACRSSVDSLPDHLAARRIPIVVDTTAAIKRILKPAIIVDAIMAKTNTGSMVSDAPIVIALGPGFNAGHDCHAVIETNRGHYLGRVIWQGFAEPDTGRPGAIPGIGTQLIRVLRAPMAGHVTAHCQIGDTIGQGAPVATVRNRSGGSAQLTAAF